MPLPPRPPHSRLRASSLSGAPPPPLSPESVTSTETDTESEDGPPTPAASFPPLAPVYTPAAAAASVESSATPPDVRSYPCCFKMCGSSIAAADLQIRCLLNSELRCVLSNLQQQQQQPAARQQILARGRYGVARENGATPRSSAAPSPRQEGNGVQPQQQLLQQPQQQQRESVHEAAARTLKQLRESRDPAIAPFAAAAAELFGGDGAAGRGQQQPTLQQRDLGLLGNMLLGQLRGSVAGSAGAA